MAINTAVNSANLANKAAQVGYAQNVAAPNKTERRQEHQRVQVLEDQGLLGTGKAKDEVEQKNLEHAAGANASSQGQRADRAGRRRVQVRTAPRARYGSPARESGEATAGSKTAKAPGQGQAETAGETALRAALRDNSRELQVQFSSARAAEGQGPAQPNSPQALKRVMLRNLEAMVRQQLAQYTGHEPYTRANYRQILGALGQMQTGLAPKSSGGSKSRGSSDPTRSEGAYRLAEKRAGRILQVLIPLPERSDEPVELVA